MSRDNEAPWGKAQAAPGVRVAESASPTRPTPTPSIAPQLTRGTSSARVVRARRIARASWAVVSVFVVESLIFGLAALPALLFWEWHLAMRPASRWVSIVFLSMALVPAYLLFAIALIVVSALAMKLLGWRAPPNASMRLADSDPARTFRATQWKGAW